MTEITPEALEALRIVIEAAEPMRLKEQADCLLGTKHRNSIQKAITKLEALRTSQLTHAVPSDTLSPDAIRDCLVTTVLATPAQPSGDEVEAVARAMAPKVFLPFDPKLHGSPVNHRFAQKMWLKNATAAIAAHIQVLETAVKEAEEIVIAKVVAWLRAESRLCDCHAREETECACGAWDDYKSKPLLQIAEDLEQGKYK